MAVRRRTRDLNPRDRSMPLINLSLSRYNPNEDTFQGITRFKAQESYFQFSFSGLESISQLS